MALKQYIEHIVKTRNIFSQGICNTAAIFLAFPETDYRGDIIDPIAWSMLCANSGGKLFIAGFQPKDSAMYLLATMTK